MTPDRITASPNPCHPGDTVTITYDAGISPPVSPPVEVTVTYDPDLGYTKMVLTEADFGDNPTASFQVVVPQYCEGMTASAAKSADLIITVQP